MRTEALKKVLSIGLACLLLVFAIYGGCRMFDQSHSTALNHALSWTLSAAFAEGVVYFLQKKGFLRKKSRFQEK